MKRWSEESEMAFTCDKYFLGCLSNAAQSANYLFFGINCGVGNFAWDLETMSRTCECFWGLRYKWPKPNLLTIPDQFKSITTFVFLSRDGVSDDDLIVVSLLCEFPDFDWRVAALTCRQPNRARFSNKFVIMWREKLHWASCCCVVIGALAIDLFRFH